MRHLSLRLAPDFGAGRPQVSLNVLLVLVLVWHGVFLRLGLGVGLGNVDRAIPQARRGAQGVVDHIEFRAGDFQQDLFLERDFVRHHGPDMVATRACHRGKTDAGVARGRFHQSASVSDFAFLLQFAQHLPGRPVLDRSERIVPFELGVEREVRRRTHPVDPHQRRRIFLAGQQLEYVVVNARLVIHVGRTGRFINHTIGRSVKNRRRSADAVASNYGSEQSSSSSL